MPGIGSGMGKCPYDPLDNSTAIYVEEGNPGNLPALVRIRYLSCPPPSTGPIYLNCLLGLNNIFHVILNFHCIFLLQYSGTNAEFTKADPVIFRSDLYNLTSGRREFPFRRTLKYDAKWLESEYSTYKIHLSIRISIPVPAPRLLILLNNTIAPPSLLLFGQLVNYYEARDD